MPIFDQGYQHWQGRLSGHAWRWLAVTRRGVQAQLKNRWVLTAVMVAWVPALLLATVLAVWGLFEQKSALLTPFLGMFREALPPEIFKDPHYFRSVVWRIAFDFFFRFEIFFAMILVLLIGPELVSQDLRFRAMPLYFSRPMRRIDYFVGKLGIIGFFLGLVTIAPAALAYALGVAFSLDFGVLKDTFRVLPASVAYGTVVLASAGTLMLAISSLSKNSRHVGGIWIGMWIIGGLLSNVLDESLHKDWCPLISYTHNLSRVGETLLDTRAAWKEVEKFVGAVTRRERPEIFADPHPWSWSAGTLLGWWGLSVWILATRVRSLDRLR